MTPFEFGSGLISIIVGLAIARVLGGIGRFLQAEDRSLRAWLFVAYCTVLFLLLILWWVVTWGLLQGLDAIAVPQLMGFATSSAVLYLAAYLLVPSERFDATGSAVSLFRLPDKAFFLCLLAHYAPMVAYILLRGDDTRLYAPSQSIQVAGLFAIVALLAAGLRVRTERGHAYMLASLALLTAVAVLIVLRPIG